MDDKEIVLKLIDYFIPEASDDEVFMQYLIERLDSYFDYSFLEQMRDSLKWRVIDCVQKTREDYAFMTDTTHHVYLDSQKKEIHFGEYVLPAYWYKEEMQKKRSGGNIAPVQTHMEEVGLWRNPLSTARGLAFSVCMERAVQRAIIVQDGKGPGSGNRKRCIEAILSIFTARKHAGNRTSLPG